jgi:hypothetical protein
LCRPNHLSLLKTAVEIAHRLKTENTHNFLLSSFFKGYLPYFISGENGSGAEHVITDFAQFVEFLRNSKQVN